MIGAFPLRLSTKLGGAFMATLANHSRTSSGRDERFFLRAAIAMTVLIFAAFSTQVGHASLVRLRKWY